MSKRRSLRRGLRGIVLYRERGGGVAGAEEGVRRGGVGRRCL